MEWCAGTQCNWTGVHDVAPPAMITQSKSTCHSQSFTQVSQSTVLFWCPVTKSSTEHLSLAFKQEDAWCPSLVYGTRIPANFNSPPGPGWVCLGRHVSRGRKSWSLDTNRLSMILRLHQHNIGYTADGFYRAMHFSAKRGIAIACRLSVRLSVCLWRWWIVIT